MSTITTEATLSLLREHNPSLIIFSEQLATSSYIGENSSAEYIISTISTICALSVVGWVVIFLTIYTVYCAVDCICLIESDVVGVVVEWRVD